MEGFFAGVVVATVIPVMYQINKFVLKSLWGFNVAIGRTIINVILPPKLQKLPMTEEERALRLELIEIAKQFLTNSLTGETVRIAKARIAVRKAEGEVREKKLKNHKYTAPMADNKLVKSILDAATITGLVAGIGWIGKKVIKGNLTGDPSASMMNYVKFTAVMAGSIALKKYLEDQKILPANM